MGIKGRPSKESIEAKMMAKDKAELICTYLNRMEKVYSEYSSKEVNEDKIAEMSMLTGKVMVTFSDLCYVLGVFDD